MALPSQSARPIARRSYMHRRSRNRHRWRLLAIPVAIAVLAIAAWQWLARDRGVADGPPGLVTGLGAIAEPAEPPSGAETDARPVTPTPVVAPAPRRPARNSARPTAAGPPARTDSRAAAGSGDRSDAAGPIVPSTPEPATQEMAAAPPEPKKAVDERRPQGTPDQRSPASTQRTARRVAEGLDLLARNQPVEARRVLTRALASGTLGLRDEEIVRERLTDLNERLVFSPEVVDGDPFTLIYTVQSNDALSRLPRKLGIQVHWRFIQHVNRISDPRRLRTGQRLKIVTGPFHAELHKHAYRMDVYLGDEPERVYVGSFEVGLGEYNSTPEGRFRIRDDSRLENPAWVNPRTRKRYEADDPTNPIGEHWLGLVGDEARLATVEGYGIHGTIEPDSIGRQASMGCIRMRPADVALVWSMLAEGVSVVEIGP